MRMLYLAARLKGMHVAITIDKSLLKDELFRRRTQMQLMRSGYCIVPDRFFILFSATNNSDLQTLETLALKLAHRYFEIDVVFASNTEIIVINSAIREADNSYVLENLTDEQLVYLHQTAVAALTTCEDLTEISHEIGANVMFGAHETLYDKLCALLQQKGINREGTSTLAIAEDDTTTKL